MTSTRSAPLLLRISLVSLPFLAGCSGEAPETSAEEAGADVEEGEAPDPAEALERLRGLVSPAEVERFDIVRCSRTAGLAAHLDPIRWRREGRAPGQHRRQLDALRTRETPPEARRRQRQRAHQLPLIHDALLI